MQGKAYWKTISSQIGASYFRDSADCILKRQQTYEEIIYSASTTTILRDGPDAKLVNTDIGASVAVPAGTFTTNNVKFIVRKDGVDAGSLPNYDDNYYIATQLKYSPQVGIIQLINYPYGNTVKYELVRYDTHHK